MGRAHDVHSSSQHEVLQALFTLLASMCHMSNHLPEISQVKFDQGGPVQKPCSSFATFSAIDQALQTLILCLSVIPVVIPRAPHISLALAGVEIISNGSGSHHQLRKLDTRIDLIKGATRKVRGPGA